MRSFLAFFLLLQALDGLAQQVLSGVVMDSTTGEPIPYASVYVLDARRSGTLTNTDGYFRLPYNLATDTVVISHLTYRGIRQPIHTLAADTLRLAAQALKLPEVSIYSGTGASVFRSVLAALDKNHAVEPVIYHVLHREFLYESDRSALHGIAEYAMDVWYAPDHSTELRIIQARKKGFSAGGEIWAKNIYVAHTLGSYFHNIYKSDLKWRESTLKRYEIGIAGSVQHEGRSLIRLELIPHKPDKDQAFTLYVDEATYAVVRIWEYRDAERTRYQETAFREWKGKWYLSYVVWRYAGSTVFQRYQPGSISNVEDVYIYQLLPDATKTDDFKGLVGLVSIPVEEFAGKWEDPYWDTYRDIPLPAWIQQMVDSK
ncbi:MAG: carboxypeptidase-like regulatory domain-containing protein [Bacteroidia bacterium]|nr:carboxypeptidase-like regulatory domain-containing protein [Bacteroidia bacterium]